MTGPRDTQAFDRLDYAPMTAADLDEVFAVEQSVYPHPWSRGNFVDSLQAGYHAWVLRDGGELAGYFLLMAAVDEAHLLNVSVAGRRQRQGLGQYVLDPVAACARCKSICATASPKSAGARHTTRPTTDNARTPS
jgi:ribosomal-protein-alanine N-acetyltransferase